MTNKFLFQRDGRNEGLSKAIWHRDSNLSLESALNHLYLYLLAELLATLLSRVTRVRVDSEMIIIPASWTVRVMRAVAQC